MRNLFFFLFSLWFQGNIHTHAWIQKPPPFFLSFQQHTLFPLLFSTSPPKLSMLPLKFPFLQPKPPPPPPPNQKLKKWIELLRPASLPPTLLLCFTGGWLMQPSISSLLHSTQFIVATLCTLLVTSTSMVINDLYDMELDKIDHHTRALPSGIITIPEAMATVGGLLGAIGYLSTTYLRSELQWFIHLSTAIVITYTPVLKRIPFVKNLACAALVSLSMFFTGLSVTNTVLSLHPHFPLLCLAMSNVFFGSLYNEIILDMRDIEGDRKHGINTIPVLLGMPISYALAFCFIYINIELHFLSVYYLFGLPKAIIHLLLYIPLLSQFRNIKKEHFTKNALNRASKATNLPLLLILLFYCGLSIMV